MKKNNLYTGIVFVIIGIALLCSIQYADDRIYGLLWGFTGATLIPGLARILRYYYWNRPRKREEYVQRLEQEKIYQQDERNVMLKDRAGRIVFQLNLYVVSLSVILFAILGNMGIVEGTKTLIYYLCALQLMNVAGWSFIYNRLLKK